jgi:hypothetical protein
MLRKLREKLTNHDMFGKIFVCPGKSFDISPPPARQQFWGENIKLISDSNVVGKMGHYTPFFILFATTLGL